MPVRMCSTPRRRYARKPGNGGVPGRLRLGGDRNLEDRVVGAKHLLSQERPRARRGEHDARHRPAGQALEIDGVEHQRRARGPRVRQLDVQVVLDRDVEVRVEHRQRLAARRDAVEAARAVVERRPQRLQFGDFDRPARARAGEAEARRRQQRHRRVQAQPVAADVRVGRDLERIVRARRRAGEQGGREDGQGETSTVMRDGRSLPTI